MNEDMKGRSGPHAVLPDGTAHAGAHVVLLGHDLRAAVSDIIGGLRLIDQTAVDEGTRLQLERIRSSGELLARLLEEGLSFMLGADALAPTTPVNIQLSRFVYDLDMRWSGRAKEKGLTLVAKICPKLPPVIAVDRIALERVLANILSNAIKYTDAGDVVLSITVSEEGTLRFEVADSGPGFSNAALDRLFQFHGRPDDTGKPGEGLGMHISKTLTARLGGALLVENRAEGGATIILELPRGAWQPVKTEGSVELPDLSRVKVLVAEDSETNQLIVGQMLAQMGAAFEIAADGVEAMHWLERENFDIALIDIEMPRLSGIEVIRQLRANDRLHSAMPIVACTAYVLRANRDAIYAAGADAILSKPLANVQALGEAIASALARRAGDVGQEAVESAELDRAAFDHLMEIAGPANVRELLDRLLSDLRRTERALLTAIAAQHSPAIRSETHVLIALAGAVGANRLMQLAAALNAAAHSRDAAGTTPARRKLEADTMAAVDRLITVVATERARLADGIGEVA